MLSDEKKTEWKKLIYNVNLVSIFVGLLLFILQLRLPELVNEAFDSVGNMIGPLNMIIAGILLAELTLKDFCSYKRLPMIILMRMVICPLLILFILKLIPFALWIAEGETIVLICYLASITPTAAVITQMSQIFQQDAKYASVISALGTLVSILTMPIMVALYQSI